MLNWRTTSEGRGGIMASMRSVVRFPVGGTTDFVRPFLFVYIYISLVSFELI